MSDMGYFVIVNGFFQCPLVANITDNDVDLIFDVAHQSQVHAVVHQNRAQTVLCHQTGGHRAINAQTTGNQHSHRSGSLCFSLASEQISF